ncbi:MAG: diacylglycerol/lipid kinase family protein, partial [Acidimicrobiia bacterium]
MSRLVLIANPAASGFTGGLHRGVVRILRPRYEVEATWPRTAAEASELAAEAAQRGVEVVAAMGGDGILHDVVQSLAGTTTALGIIPAGTTNVLARLLGVPLRPGRAARLLAGEHLVRTEPAIRLILHRDRTADRALAVFATGLGFDAEVVAAADAEPYRKYRFGWAHYTRTTLELAWSRFRQRPPHLRVIEAASPSRRDGRRADAAGVMVQFRRAYTYLGRVPLRLSTALPDPMRVLVVESLP